MDKYESDIYKFYESKVIEFENLYFQYDELLQSIDKNIDKKIGYLSIIDQEIDLDYERQNSYAIQDINALIFGNPISWSKQELFDEDVFYCARETLDNELNELYSQKVLIEYNVQYSYWAFRLWKCVKEQWYISLEKHILSFQNRLQSILEKPKEQKDTWYESREKSHLSIINKIYEEIVKEINEFWLHNDWEKNNYLIGVDKISCTN